MLGANYTWSLLGVVIGGGALLVATLWWVYAKYKRKAR